MVNSRSRPAEMEKCPRLPESDCSPSPAQVQEISCVHEAEATF